MRVPSAALGYSEQDVSHLLGLPVREIRRWAREGLLSAPEAGEELQVSFDDIVVLRAAKRLLDADIPPRRVRAALKKLRDRLPVGSPLSGVRIGSLGRQIVVRDQAGAWNPESGQCLFDFGLTPGGSSGAEAPCPLTSRSEERAESRTALDWYELGCELEATSAAEARAAYRQALALEPSHVDAHLNLGRLLHEAGDLRGAEDHYRRALAADPRDATAAFNLGVLLEDLGSTDEALSAYEHALEQEPLLEDAAHNAVRLYESRGDKATALRLLKRLRERTR